MAEDYTTLDTLVPPTLGLTFPGTKVHATMLCIMPIVLPLILLLLVEFHNKLTSGCGWYPSILKLFLGLRPISLVTFHWSRSIGHFADCFAEHTADLTALEGKYGSNGPQPCGTMVQEKCSHIIAGWTKGGIGDCYDGLVAATKVGAGGHKKAVLEVHCNNPDKLVNKSDSSGFDLYLDKNLRPYDLGVLTVGQNGIKIPAGRTDFPVTGQCSAKCISDKMTSSGVSSVKVIAAELHIHTIGSAGSLVFDHNNGSMTTVAHDPSFNYNGPREFTLDTTLSKTDTLRVECRYDATGRPQMTNYGPATSDEMCYSYITYYPKLDDFTLCLSYGKKEHCSGSGTLSEVTGCHFNEAPLTATLTRLEEKCSKMAAGQNVCDVSNCLPLVSSSSDDPCLGFGKDWRMYLEYVLQIDPKDHRYLRMLRSCDEDQRTFS